MSVDFSSTISRWKPVISIFKAIKFVISWSTSQIHQPEWWGHLIHLVVHYTFLLYSQILLNRIQCRMYHLINHRYLSGLNPQGPHIGRIDQVSHFVQHGLVKGWWEVDIVERAIEGKREDIPKGSSTWVSWVVSASMESTCTTKDVSTCTFFFFSSIMSHLICLQNGFWPRPNNSFWILKLKSRHLTN